MIICPPTCHQIRLCIAHVRTYVHVHAPSPPKFRVHPTYPVTHAAVIVIIRCLVAGLFDHVRLQTNDDQAYSSSSSSSSNIEFHR